MSEFAADLKLNIIYTAPALHIEFDKLKDTILNSLNQAGSGMKQVLLFGSMCHPDIDVFTEPYQVVRLEPRNCIELILGKEALQEKEKSARIFYLTPGWLEHWREIFRQAQGWDEIDARQNFGFYDKILLLDTGVAELSEEVILEFYEYTQVPIEIEAVDLTIFKSRIAEALKKAYERATNTTPTIMSSVPATRKTDMCSLNTKNEKPKITT